MTDGPPTVALAQTDFVAVYSCEGSGGIAPHFPVTHKRYSSYNNALINKALSNDKSPDLTQATERMTQDRARFSFKLACQRRALSPKSWARSGLWAGLLA